MMMSATKQPPRNQGFSLLELMIALAILAIALVMALPSFTEMFERQRLRSAAESVMTHLYLAKSEAISRREPVYLSFSSSGWCLGVSTAPGCDCSITDPATANACVLPVHNGVKLSRYAGDQHSGVSLTAAGFASASEAKFEPVRGSTTPGQIQLSDSNGKQLNATVSLLGQFALCRPNGSATMSGYSAC